MAYTVGIPTELQIKRQLARMLESDIFVRRTNQGALLKGIVEIALQEGAVSHRRLREVVYNNLGEPSLLRVQAKNLGGTTAEYYSGPGENDLVHIYLPAWVEPEKQHRPEGSNYMPQFEFNLRHELTRKYLAAWVKINGGNLSLIPDAIKMLTDILSQDGDYADAWAALAGAHCWIAALVFRHQPEERREPLEEARQCIEIAMKLAPNSWHSHAAKAFHMMLCEDEEGAEREFAIARHLNSSMTETYPAFLFFIVITGKAEAAGLIESRALELFRNPEAQAMHGQMLELTGHPDKAEAHFREALELDPNAAMCHLGLSRVLKKLGRPDEAKVHLQRAEVLFGPETFAMWKAAAAIDDGESDPS